MARRSGFARHPRCGARGIPRKDRADEITPNETIHFRSYTCPRCTRSAGRPWHFWTAETIYLDDAPTSCLRRKMAEDFETSSPTPALVATVGR